MSKRLLITLCAAALATAACGSIPEGEVEAGEGARFVPFVTEFLDDAGLGNAVAVDAEGVPSTSYLIFPAVLAEGEIPVGRPLGAPYITTDDKEPKDGAAVGLASLSADGVWTRGAAAQVRETPAGVFIPFGPAFEQSLIGATAENTNGTDLAVDDSGTRHVVWTGKDGVYYASAADTSTVERVYRYGASLRRAGPIGRPSVAVDADGVPWVAYTVNAGSQEVRVAKKTDEGWDTQTIASIPRCSGCPQPLPTRIGLTSGGPTVAWVDTGAGSVMVSSLQGQTWTATEVAGDVGGEGLDMAVDADGNAVVTFYDGNGGVQLARQSGATWSVSTIADATPPSDDATGNLAPMTGVAVDDQGAMAAAWEDADGVVLATSDDGETFTPVETLDTIGGRSPSVGISPDGTNVFVAWFDPEGENLRFGVQGDLGGLAVAAPSPTIDPADIPAAPSPGGGGECGADGTVALDIVASGIAWSTTCLVAPAGEPFTVNVDNQDDGIPHNFDLLTEEGGDQIAATEVAPGPVQEPLDVDPLDPGEYFYQCDVHPTMTGNLVAIEGGGGGGGGG
ncbi:MAG: cupredoxin domain-containing protein [Actinomycetota bacterium]